MRSYRRHQERVPVDLTSEGAHPLIGMTVNQHRRRAAAAAHRSTLIGLARRAPRGADTGERTRLRRSTSGGGLIDLGHAPRSVRSQP